MKKLGMMEGVEEAEDVTAEEDAMMDRKGGTKKRTIIHEG
jgi:hypothetical protein